MNITGFDVAVNPSQESRWRRSTFRARTFKFAFFGERDVLAASLVVSDFGVVLRKPFFSFPTKERSSAGISLQSFLALPFSFFLIFLKDIFLKSLLYLEFHFVQSLTHVSPGNETFAPLLRGVTK